jgi:hypothetical protein
MNGKQHAPRVEARILAWRIWRLELEERDAVRRRDWSAARSIALQRTALKAAHCQTVARRRA